MSFHLPGGYQPRDPRDFTLYCLRLRSIHIRTWRTTPHVQAGQRLRVCYSYTVRTIKRIRLVLFGFSRTFIYLRDLPNDKRVPIDNFILFVTTQYQNTLFMKVMFT